MDRKSKGDDPQMIPMSVSPLHQGWKTYTRPMATLTLVYQLMGHKIVNGESEWSFMAIY